MKAISQRKERNFKKVTLVQHFHYYTDASSGE